MDLEEQSDLGSHCLSMRIQIYKCTTKKHKFYDMRFKG